MQPRPTHKLRSSASSMVPPNSHTRILPIYPKQGREVKWHGNKIKTKMLGREEKEEENARISPPMGDILF